MHSEFIASSFDSDWNRQVVHRPSQASQEYRANRIPQGRSSNRRDNTQPRIEYPSSTIGPSHTRSGEVQAIADLTTQFVTPLTHNGNYPQPGVLTPYSYPPAASDDSHFGRRTLQGIPALPSIEANLDEITTAMNRTASNPTSHKHGTSASRAHHERRGILGPPYLSYETSQLPTTDDYNDLNYPVSMYLSPGTSLTIRMNSSNSDSDPGASPATLKDTRQGLTKVDVSTFTFTAARAPSGIRTKPYGPYAQMSMDGSVLYLTTQQDGAPPGNEGEAVRVLADSEDSTKDITVKISAAPPPPTDQVNALCLPEQNLEPYAAGVMTDIDTDYNIMIQHLEAGARWRTRGGDIFYLNPGGAVTIDMQFGPHVRRKRFVATYTGPETGHARSTRPSDYNNIPSQSMKCRTNPSDRLAQAVPMTNQNQAPTGYQAPYEQHTGRISQVTSIPHQAQGTPDLFSSSGLVNRDPAVHTGSRARNPYNGSNLGLSLQGAGSTRGERSAANTSALVSYGSRQKNYHIPTSNPSGALVRRTFPSQATQPTQDSATDDNGYDYPHPRGYPLDPEELEFYD
ncbi:hypothetical protein M231_00030 [Tremella mesenterica]|uniref:Uncharacterized protein n=1 Tax=Tremella mesenterica TaxID=5217 RepID=A0A4Q1BWM1_TREME|nr:hypothetical protein M231_00030 [Tremella mesenterica]